jgi:hypothetical protein
LTWFNLATVALLTASVSSCSERPARTHAGQSSEPPGLTTVELPRLTTAPAPWATVPEYTTLAIDTLQLGAGESFFGCFLADGSLVVANGSSIVRLSRDGALDKVLARQGNGPGEFQVILGLGVADDGSLFASDHLTGRLTQLSSKGEVVRTIARLSPITGNAQSLPIAILPDGRILAVPWQWQAAREPLPSASGPATVRDRVPVVVWDDQGHGADTVTVLQGLERSSGFVAAFARSALYAARGGNRWAAGTSDSIDITVYDGTVPRLRIVAPRAGAPVTKLMRARRDSAITARFGPAVGEAVVTRQKGAGGAATTPDVGGILYDAEGRLWIGGYVVPGERERRWHIFSDRGVLLGQVMLPAVGDPLLPSRTELLDVAHGRVALARETDDGEVYVEVRRLVRK